MHLSSTRTTHTKGQEENSRHLSHLLERTTIACCILIILVAMNYFSLQPQVVDSIKAQLHMTTITAETFETFMPYR